MKRKILILMAAAMMLGGCSGKASTEDATIFEKIGASEQENTGSGTEESESNSSDNSADGAQAQKEETVGTDNAQAEGSDPSGTSEAADSDDYTDTIKGEIDDIAGSASDLSDELVKVNSLYDKYDEMRMNAENQTSMNILSKWGTVVWKNETLSLLDRINQCNSAGNGQFNEEYEKWEKYVPTMAERMSQTYKDGSIYPMIYSYNEAMRYKREAYVLASTLADLKSDPAFHFPDSTRCGYYGDYAGDSYLIITEGMESGSYDVLIHFDDTTEIHGWGVAEEGEPDSDTYLLFTSDDGGIVAYLSHSILEASLYVKESDNPAVSIAGVYTFDFQY